MQQAEEMIGGTGADRCSRQRKCKAAWQQSDAADGGNERRLVSRAMLQTEEMHGSIRAEQAADRVNTLQHGSRVMQNTEKMPGGMAAEDSCTKGIVTKGIGTKGIVT